MHSRTLRRGAGVGCVAFTLAAAPACTARSGQPSTHESGTAPAVVDAATPPTSAPPRVATRTPGGVHRVTARSLGKSWHPGCPVGPAHLREVGVAYWGFDHRRHVGTLIVNRLAVHAIRTAFTAMARHRFPIRRVVPVARYGGRDNRSMSHDNTSAFNCRYAVATRPHHWSEHAFGEAIDIDPRENPYRLGRILPSGGAAYADRRHIRPGMITATGVAVRAFTNSGWGWGGRWTSTPDYQHFSVNGR